MQNKEISFLKRLAVIFVALAVMLSMPLQGFAEEATPTDVYASGYTITKSNGSTSRISSNQTLDVALELLYTQGNANNVTTADLSRVSDGFSGGDISIDSKSTGTTLIVNITNLRYKGGSKELGIFVKAGSSYQQVQFTITECYSTAEAESDAAANKAEWESNQPPVRTYTKPTIIFGRSDLDGSIKAKESRRITVTVKNTSSRTISNAVINFIPSEDLMIRDSQTAFELGNISGGSTASQVVTIKALDKISSQNQYIEADLTYDYTSNSEGESTQASDSFKLSIPASITKEKEPEQGDDTKTEAPVPNIIITAFNYGGESVAANSDFNLSMTFKNTGKKIPVENVVATVDAGADFIINGGINTFYYESVGAGKSKVINVPLKVIPTITQPANTVTVNFTYEYVDNKVRKQGTADLKVSVPAYQPDKFVIDKPKPTEEAVVGMETTITMDYINKGKAIVSNVSASISGDVMTDRGEIVVGNVESGKNGTIVFPVVPNNEGENKVKIKITYEGANGDTKERVFTTKINAFSFEEPELPDDFPEMPEEPNSNKLLGIPKWAFILLAALLVIVGLVIFTKARKKSKAKKQQELWAKWDEEESLKEESQKQGEN